MTREAIIEQLQEVVDKHRKEAYISCPDDCWCWNVQNIVLHIELSLLPPAEGAEPTFTEQDELDLQALMVVVNYGQATIEQMERVDDLTRRKWKNERKPQPIAEGAEEILKPYLIRGDDTDFMGDIFFVSRGCALKSMQEFATLHAQKIADKMVSERLREELGLFNDWLNGAAKKYFTSPYIDEYLDSEYYLKSREK